jgi:hypothetical protein
METNSNKDIIHPQNTIQTEPRNNSIQRPQKIQKISIPHMELGVYQDYGASSSGRQPNYHGPCNQNFDENPRTNQENNGQSTYGSSSTDEGDFFMYEEEHIGEGIKQCQNSIIGKLLSPKQIPKQVLHSSLMGIWCSPASFKITELENNMFQFFFEKEADITRVLKGEP